MKRKCLWLLTFLMTIGLFVLASAIMAQDGIWVRKADMPVPKSLLATSVVNGKIYAFGGWDLIIGFYVSIQGQIPGQGNLTC